MTNYFPKIKGRIFFKNWLILIIKGIHKLKLFFGNSVTSLCLLRVPLRNKTNYFTEGHEGDTEFHNIVKDILIVKQHFDQKHKP